MKKLIFSVSKVSTIIPTMSASFNIVLLASAFIGTVYSFVILYKSNVSTSYNIRISSGLALTGQQ